MAKKCNIKTKPRDDGKSRFELRFDNDLYDSIKEAADDTGVSVNQLMQGIARWAMKHANPGEEVVDADNYEIRGVEQPGSIWFGHDMDEEEVQIGPDPDHVETRMIPAQLFFSLDFTERRAVREPDRGSSLKRNER